MDQSKRQQKKPSSGWSAGRVIGGMIKGVFLLIGRAIATIIMVGIITGCIVACVMTVYILQYIGADEQIDLDTIKLGYTSILWAEDPKTGEQMELQRLYYSDNNRIWIDYNSIPNHTKEALVAVEDKRYWDHDGVDWRRTVGAFIGMFLPIEGTTTGGGSTITQQLVKNITDDDDYRVDRKMREIFRALDVSRRYSRDQILETYLNVVSFGNGTNGIQSAANTYFDKNAEDLTLAESAAIVGITQRPTDYNPFLNPDKNRERQLYVLDQMLGQEKITQKEYDDAVAQEMEFKSARYYEKVGATQSYFVDHVIESVITDLMEQKGYTKAYATEQLYQGGFNIYTTVDLDIQEHLENIYSDVDANFPPLLNPEYPQSAAVITDINGKIVAMVGGTEEKTGARTFNRATMAKRQPGSSLKPLATYSMAFEYNMARWSTIFEDTPIKLSEPGKETVDWPVNHYRSYMGRVTVEWALAQSTNTIPAKLVQLIGPQTVYNFLHDQLEFDSLVPQDIALAPMSLGAMTYGVTPLEMAGGYQIFANGGNFTKPYAYYRVEDAEGRIVLQPETMPKQVISEDTAVVINKLLQNNVTASYATGTRARLSTMPTGGKTGTSDDDVDQWFIGVTPYYVCQIWMGYDTPQTYNDNGQVVTNKIRYSTYAPPILFKTIMEPIHEDLEVIPFYDSDSVVSLSYCTITGDLSGPSCPSASGWYKSSDRPGQCTGNHTIAGSSDDSEDGEPSGVPADDSGFGVSTGGGQQYGSTNVGALDEQWEQRDM